MPYGMLPLNEWNLGNSALALRLQLPLMSLPTFHFKSLQLEIAALVYDALFNLAAALEASSRICRSFDIVYFLLLNAVLLD